MKHPFRSLLLTGPLFLLLSLFPSCAFGFGVKVGSLSVRLSDDSLRVSLRLDLGMVVARPWVSYTFTPVLRAPGRIVELPPVLVSGQRRLRFDRRERALSSSGYLREPYCILPGNPRDRRDTVFYSVCIAYSPWMRTASLALMQESKDCCDLELLTVDTLLPILGLADPASDSSGFPESSVFATYGSSAGSSGSSTPVESSVRCLPCAAMVSWLDPDLESEKHRTGYVTLYIDYPQGRHHVERGYRNNALELSRLDSLLLPLRGDSLSTIRRLEVCGYASPEGAYYDNDALSRARADRFVDYMSSHYSLSRSLFRVSHVAEDWDRLCELLRAYRPAYWEESLAVISGTGIFEGRERDLMVLRGGVPYREMSARLFPLLRRIGVVVRYDVRHVAPEEAARLVYTHPQLLSLQEMYRVARYYRPGTEQYREIYEIAAYHFPDDPVAHINAASAVLLSGDTVSARHYLERFRADPRAWNDLGVLAYAEGKLEEAADWFRKAVGVDPYRARKNLERLMAEGRRPEDVEGNDK
ncbi:MULTISPECIES: hypothetical protein [Bacteroides]|uniref:hypothetical protein n=1 Tax=Bacteroides TaxID=816 RepID=UPI002287AD3A|nr:MULTISPECIES: hypothetical protein [Bacteroides]MCY6342326.1 hypothetical protein [Bacteroides fragilis]MCZ2669798.1 hypothetical protein [Bacteroides fragilis]MDV6203425.1 hypothetical protein [Bacteroides hominis (ex Liu et al. 2022)]